jgi:hypothetical protein
LIIASALTADAEVGNTLATSARVGPNSQARTFVDVKSVWAIVGSATQRANKVAKVRQIPIGPPDFF